MPDEKDAPVVLPLLKEPTPTESVPSMPIKAKAWYVLRGTTILGVLSIALALVFFVVYLFSDKEHLHEQIILWVGIGFFGFGAHLISRQSVKSFVNEFGRFVPWGKKEKPEPPDGDGE